MRYLSSSILVMLLGACATYSDTLEQKLAGKTSEQQRVILAQECSRKIDATTKPDTSENRRHFERMREICRDMTGHKKPIINDEK